MKIDNKLKFLYFKLGMQIAGLIMFILSIVLSWIWYGWHLPLVIFLFVFANNIQQYMNNIKYPKI